MFKKIFLREIFLLNDFIVKIMLPKNTLKCQNQLFMLIQNVELIRGLHKFLATASYRRIKQLKQIYSRILLINCACYYKL